MTTTDRDAFWAIFCRLSMLFGKKPDAEMADEYFQALIDLPLVLVTDATVSLKKSSRFWPKPVDWREACFKLEQPKPGFSKERWTVTAGGERVATYICLKCHDYGFRWECGCAFEDVDGRCATHGTGTSASRMPVTFCECRSTNPEFLAGHRTTRQFTEQR
jgi:hypothetical protein